MITLPQESIHRKHLQSFDSDPQNRLMLETEILVYEDVLTTANYGTGKPYGDDNLDLTLGC